MVNPKYQVRFLTPAFLGNARQSGQWRTPPFKHLLRQWWRVAYAADHSFHVDIGQMRREEGLLFGNAWLSHREGEREVPDHRKSLVRMRLDRWDEGKLKSWNELETGTVRHPEVQKTKFRVGPQAYLGYGPLDGRGGTQLKSHAAIQAGESAVLAFAFPTSHHHQDLKQVTEVNTARIKLALWLMDRYGTLGGRNRNGWGSCTLIPQEDTPALEGEAPLRDWHDCLDRDWPHAIGRDQQGALIWQTAPHGDWKALMKTLAIVKIGLRTQFVFPSNAKPPHPNPLERHWLSYPITRHSTSAFSQGARLPNPLHFKARATVDGKLVGVIYHMPCLPPQTFNPRPFKDMIIGTWKRVHKLLDELCKPKASRNYSSIVNNHRRTQLTLCLNSVILKRIPE